MSTRSVGPEFDQHARTASDGVGAQRKTASRKNVLMCKPEFFTVSYRINPWMNPLAPTDTSRAVRQWQNLYDIYADLGFDVQLIDPVRGLPDMVYAANGGFVIDNVAYGARFAHVERQPEGPAFMEWFSAHGFEVAAPKETNEGEGDFLLIGATIFAGMGFRSTAESHDEVARIFGREVVSLTLVNPSFYHLDTALAVLDSGSDEPGDSGAIGYVPRAFDERSRAVLTERFPDAIIVSETDAAVLGLNLKELVTPREM